MMYTKKAVQAIKTYRGNCSTKEDICKIICNIIMPEWDNIIKELDNNINKLEAILHKLLSHIVSYNQPILDKFETYQNYNRDMGQCYRVSI